MAIFTTGPALPAPVPPWNVPAPSPRAPEVAIHGGQLGALQAAHGAGQGAEEGLRDQERHSSHQIMHDPYPALNRDESYNFLLDLVNAPLGQDTVFSRILMNRLGFRNLEHAIDKLHIDASIFKSGDSVGGLTRNTVRGMNWMRRIPHFFRDRGKEALTSGLALGAFALAAPPVAAFMGAASVGAALVPTALEAGWAIAGGAMGASVVDIFKNRRLYRCDRNGKSLALNAGQEIVDALVSARRQAITAFEDIRTHTPPYDQEQMTQRLAVVVRAIVEGAVNSNFNNVMRFWEVDGRYNVWNAVGQGVGSLGAGIIGPHAYNAISGLINARNAGTYALGTNTLNLVNNTWQVAGHNAPGAGFRILGKEFATSWGATGTQHIARASAAAGAVFGGSIGSRIYSALSKRRHNTLGRRGLVKTGLGFGDQPVP